MLKTSNFLIGFLNPEQLENYLIKKYGKIIADENNINIDCLCVSKFIKL